MKITKITQSEYLKTGDTSAAAYELLNEDRFQFVRDWMQSVIDYATKTILNDEIREVQEVVPITEKITRIFKKPKDEQVKELVGQYKLATKFFQDMTQLAAYKDQLDEAIKNKLVVVEEQK